MKKHRNKKLNLILIFTIIFSTLVFTGVESFALEAAPAVKSPQSQKTVLKQNSNVQTTAATSTIPEKNAYALTHMEKTGFKYGVFKFFIAMFGVLVSAVAIFLGLNFYKKIVMNNSAKLDNIDYDKNLESPKDFRDAINIFLDKTDK